MRDRCHKYIICCAISIFCIFFFDGFNHIASAIDNEQNKNIEAELVWSENCGANYEIFYSSFRDNFWSAKVKLTENRLTNLLPSVYSGNDDNIWVVWTTLNNKKSYLRYCFFNGKSWSIPKQINTKLPSNMSPSVIIDKRNITWIVWAGFDGQDDDIFFTRWNGDNWDTPKRINTDDKAPDILPVIGVDKKGDLWVRWSGYNGKTYRDYFSKWTGSRWSDEIEVLSNASLDSTVNVNKKFTTIPDLPDFLNDLSKASIHIRTEEERQSIRLRDLKNMLKGDEDTNSYFDQIEKYSNEKSIIKVEESDEPYVIIGFGDSITQGSPYINEPGDGRRVGGYEPDLEALLGQSSQQSSVLNYGVGGETTYLGVMRIGEDTIGKHEGARYILILEGTNDVYFGISWQSTVYNLGIMIDNSRSYNVEPIIATLTPDTKPGHEYKNIDTTYNPAIRDLAVEKNVKLSDQYKAFADLWSLYTYDGTHPNKAGYEVMASKWLDSITVDSNTNNSGNTMVEYASGIAVDFDVTYGLWYYNGTTWSRLSTNDSEWLCAYGTRLVVDFGANWGLWEYDGSSWTQISNADAGS